MFQYSCTRVARKMRRLGFAKKVAARFARIFQIMMAILGGLMGLFFGSNNSCGISKNNPMMAILGGLMGLFFEIPQELFEPIAIAGKNPVGTRYGLFLPAVFAIRR